MLFAQTQPQQSKELRIVSAGIDDPAIDLFDREMFERAWQDASAPTRATVIPDTTIVVSRSSPNDFQDRQIYLWIDDVPLGKIRYGQAISKNIEPGRHTVRAFNTLFTRQIAVEAAPGEEVRLNCGTGMPTVGWLMMVFLHVTYLRVWIERDVLP
jgi:hypothetical protein